MSERRSGAMTETQDWSLEEHDRIYHPGGYKKGDKCKVRERLEKSDDPDWMLRNAELDLGSELSEEERKPLSGDDTGRYGENSLWRTGHKLSHGRKGGARMSETDKEAFELAYRKAKASGDTDFMKAAMRLRYAGRNFDRKDAAESDTWLYGKISNNEAGMAKAIKAFKEARRSLGKAKAKRYLGIVGK